ncbi:MAG: DUF72 domain-containing protein [Candidatus Aminicenantes bacterium]|nr:DUF72 domain-containing protein [Candidatus Aminicenantes bacterium]
MAIKMQYSFGTAGWSYKDWRGTVYPEKIPAGFNHLEFLARDFQFVEVNTTFYRIPTLKLTTGWVRKTESLPDFKFWIKVFRDFTHKRVMRPQDVESFKQAIAPLAEAGKLAGVLAQFPYSFKLNSENFAYLNDLTHNFGEYTQAVEFRHNSWEHGDVLDSFVQDGVIWVNIDQPVISLSLGLTDYVTHPGLSYFRLHGRNYGSWFSGAGRDARYDYDYSALELNEIAEKIKKLKEKAKKIFVSGNNHYKGSAVKNLKELKKILKK